MKEGCIVAPIMTLVAITLASLRAFHALDSVGIECRLDCGLFDLRRLQAKIKTFSAVIYALQYADYAAFPSLTADELQHCLDVISET